MAKLPDKYIAVIEDTDEARDAHGNAHGSIEVSLGARQIRALEDGKAVASFDGEYVTYITFEAPVDAIVMQQAIAKLQDLHTEANAEADKRKQGEMAAYHVGRSHAYDDAVKLLESLLAA